MKRRQFLRNSFYFLSTPLVMSVSACSKTRVTDNLLEADANGVRLAEGFSSRLIAQSGQPVLADSTYLWHDAPDGGAVFPLPDGGWIYVSNSEVNHGGGGVGAVRFNASAEIVDAYSILTGTSRNCAGGVSLWDTWLSCEEIPQGRVWECDIFGLETARVLPALGVFNHEAVAIDPNNKVLYLTEDRRDGGLYRYLPHSIDDDGKLDLDHGQLQIAVVDRDMQVSWHNIEDPVASRTATRYQVAQSTAFNGGEGIVWHDGVISFSTKGDNRIWAYDCQNHGLSVIYDPATHPNPILTGVDNITVSNTGELLVAEDGGDLQIVAILENQQLLPVMQMQGHDRSEIAGPAFSPDGSRLYFSSQRGETGLSSDGKTYEITGPFAQLGIGLGD